MWETEINGKIWRAAGYLYVNNGVASFWRVGLKTFFHLIWELLKVVLYRLHYFKFILVVCYVRLRKFPWLGVKFSKI